MDFDPLPNISQQYSLDIGQSKTPRWRFAGKSRYSASRHWTG
jgi:hypothetical protein